MNSRTLILLFLFWFSGLTALAGYLVQNISSDDAFNGKFIQQNQIINRLSTQSIIELFKLREAMHNLASVNNIITTDQFNHIFNRYGSGINLLFETNHSTKTNNTSRFQKPTKQLIASISQMSLIFRQLKPIETTRYDSIMTALQQQQDILESIQQQTDFLDFETNIFPVTHFNQLKTKITWTLSIGWFFCLCVSLLYLFEIKKKTLLSKQLDKYSEELENTITQRTADLTESNKQLEVLSLEDSLTNLYNRRYFDDALAKEFSRAKRSNDRLSLLMCDIDNFKSYNDSFGHQAGDHCLQMIAGYIQSECQRGSDVVARYGGEEFAIILPDTSLSIAVKTAMKIGNSIWSHKLPASDSINFDRVTISIGVAELLQNEIGSQSNLISVADRFLYDAKNHGRNQLVSSLGSYKFRSIEHLKD